MQSKLSSTKKISRTERIDVVAGSARKGQSYLFWKKDQPFQLPVTYWTETDSIRLFDNLRTAPIELERIRAIEVPGVTHLGFRVVK